MEEPKQEIRSETERLWDALADEHLDNERRYNSVARRLTELEDKSPSREDDPMKAIGSMIVVMVLLQVVLPLVGEMIMRWRSES